MGHHCLDKGGIEGSIVFRIEYGSCPILMF